MLRVCPGLPVPGVPRSSRTAFVPRKSPPQAPPAPALRTVKPDRHGHLRLPGWMPL